MFLSLKKKKVTEVPESKGMKISGSNSAQLQQNLLSACYVPDMIRSTESPERSEMQSSTPT